MSEEFDLAVIGGGIVGLATAGALMAKRPGARIVVLEAAPQVGTHQSGHNSGVLHSGLYYKPGSLRARLCVQGRRRMVDYCAAHDIPHEVTGKLVVATEPSELGALDRLHTRGTANGLRGIRALAPGEWADIEPHVAGLRALW
ncbi:MAG: FAD-dependent oxidoreductase, partial [Acidimicrobiia bacterium]